MAKLEGGRPVTVAYLGGSITEMSGWRNMTTDGIIWRRVQEDIVSSCGVSNKEAFLFRTPVDGLSFVNCDFANCTGVPHGRWILL